ncbi:hypothetical protein [Actinophytocola oryzae]|uniref:Uncharacterized protein n=1 Tax=Actinophytocola oryzae TaxID=502181 RepID=A0A4R7W634_9PSEU|nr:hypothetical protein [Actinophytocola oryzae]TDV57469.1 hypothetical protein CLV71_101340 [Actinophytocola oryzae]
MNDIPRAVITGRRVAMAGLIIAMVLTVLAVVMLIALWATRPVVV